MGVFRLPHIEREDIIEHRAPGKDSPRVLGEHRRLRLAP